VCHIEILGLIGVCHIEILGLIGRCDVERKGLIHRYKLLPAASPRALRPVFPQPGPQFLPPVRSCSADSN
jgi:hypothetical protein